jgi:lipopolysaccharide transport system permease protein
VNEQRPPIVHYTPEPQLVRPKQFLRSTVASLRSSRAIAVRFMVRDLQAQYRQSVLGYVWLLAPVAATTLLWVLLSASKIVNPGEMRIPYPVFAMVGTLLFQGFLDGLDAPLVQLDKSANLLGKVNFPAEALLLSALMQAGLNVMLRIVVALPVILAFGVAIGPEFLLAPVGALALVVLGFGVGLVLTPLGALYRDVPQGIGFVKTFLFLVTPAVYAPIPTGIGHVLYRLNPIARLLVVARNWMTGGAVSPGAIWFVVLAGAVGLVGVAWLLFRLALPHLVDRVST